MIIIYIISAAAIIIILWFILTYNKLIKSRILVDEGFSAIGTYLQQRFDMIPNLVEIVKGYIAHENETLVDVTKWRNQGLSAKNTNEQAQAATGLSGSLFNMLSLAESYPDLKADSNFLELQNNLNEIEEKLNNARRYYNATVREYNTLIAILPNNIISGLLNFKASQFFEEQNESASAPKISFK